MELASLFSLSLDAPFLKDCAGIALDNICLEIKTLRKKFQETGRLLMTHRGLRGPTVLRLTAFAARELNDVSYKSLLKVNWLASNDPSSIRNPLPFLIPFNSYRFAAFPIRPPEEEGLCTSELVTITIG